MIGIHFIGGSFSMQKASKRILLASVSAGAAAAALTKYFIDVAFKSGRSSSSKRITGRYASDEGRRYAEWIRQGEAWIVSQNMTEVDITGRDGVRLHGHWLPAENAERTLLLMHGYRSSWLHDFSVGAEYYHRMGCNLLFAEQRGHGESGGKYIGYGVLERWDCLAWADYLIRNSSPDLPIYAGGISMGASTVLMAAGAGYPDRVRGVIADCGFTSPGAILERVAGDMLHIPCHPLVKAVGTVCRAITGFGLYDFSTVDAMRTNKTPVLFIHGEEDRFVPLSMTMDNYHACTAEKQLLVVPGAGHGTSLLADSVSYLETLRKFFEKHDGEAK